MNTKKNISVCKCFADKNDSMFVYSNIPRYKHVLYLAVVTMLIVYIFTSTHTVEHDGKINVVGYYQTSGSNRLASTVVLQFFLSTYPSAPLYIHYDTDHPLPRSEATLITYNEKNIDKSAVSNGMYFSSVTAMENYLKRIKKAASLQKNGWVLLLEDDVWVWTRIKPNDLRYDVSGTCRHQFSSECSKCPAAIQAHSRHRQVFRNASCYGAYGGHYINSSRIIGLKDYQGLLRDLLNAVGGPVASDILLSAVILSDGGSIGDNLGFYEPNDLSQVLLHAKYDPPNIFHQMKYLYSNKV